MALIRVERPPLPFRTMLQYWLELDAEINEARCLIEVRDDLLNRGGSVHGGVLATLLDTACGTSASLSIDDEGLTPVITLSLTINYLFPATAGVIQAIGRYEGGGKSIKYANGELLDEAGSRLATASGVFKLMPGA